MTITAANTAPRDLFEGFAAFLSVIVAPLRTLFSDVEDGTQERANQSAAEKAFSDLAIAMASPFLIAKTEAQYEAAERFCVANARKIRELVEAWTPPAVARPSEELRPPKQDLYARGLLIDFEEHLELLNKVIDSSCARAGFRMPKRSDVRDTINQGVAYIVPVVVAALRDDPNYSKWAVARAHAAALRSLVVCGRLFGADDADLMTPAALKRVEDNDAAQLKAVEERAAKLQRLRDEDLASSDWMN